MSSFIPWMGGKSRIANRLNELLPEHQCYVEVFAGAANLLFTKEKVNVRYTISLDKSVEAQDRTELVIANYPLPKQW